MLAHPGVAEAVCFAAPDAHYGEVVAAAATAVEAADAASAVVTAREKRRKGPEELSFDILVHFAHTARAFDQVGVGRGKSCVRRIVTVGAWQLTLPAHEPTWSVLPAALP